MSQPTRTPTAAQPHTSWTLWPGGQRLRKRSEVKRGKLIPIRSSNTAAMRSRRVDPYTVEQHREPSARRRLGYPLHVSCGFQSSGIVGSRTHSPTAGCVQSGKVIAQRRQSRPDTRVASCKGGNGGNGGKMARMRWQKWSEQGRKGQVWQDVKVAKWRTSGV